MNGNSDSKFQLIHKSSYLKLQSILQKRLPLSFQLYNTIQLGLASNCPDSEEEDAVKFYSYDGIIDDHSIIVGLDCIQVKKTDKGVPVIHLSVHSPNILTPKIAEEFVKSFTTFGTDDLSFAVERNSSPLILQALLNKGYILSIRSCDMVYMTNDPLETDKYDTTTETYIIKSLEPEDAKIVTDQWTYGNWINPEYYAKRCIEKHPSCGVYSKDTRELMSWAMSYNSGSFGMLYTPEKFRGQGLGKIVIKNIIQQFKEKGLHPGTGVEPRNIVSANIMNKLGFKHTHSLDFIFTK